MFDAVGDLFRGSCCVGCGRAGRLVCLDCLASLPTTAVGCRPTPCPEGLAPAWTSGSYEGLLRELILGHKERGLLALVRPLGLLLALAVAAATDRSGQRSPEPVTLVPVPSRRSTIRERGCDVTSAMTRNAARQLRAAGQEAEVSRLVAIRGSVADQAGLTSAQRAANLQGAFWCPSSVLAAGHRRRLPGRVIVCDDVLTTGATAHEAQRALAAVGVRVEGIATVAATRRRGRSCSSDSSDRSLVLFHGTD